MERLRWFHFMSSCFGEMGVIFTFTRIWGGRCLNGYSAFWVISVLICFQKLFAVIVPRDWIVSVMSTSPILQTEEGSNIQKERLGESLHWRCEASSLSVWFCFVISTFLNTETSCPCWEYHCGLRKANTDPTLNTPQHRTEQRVWNGTAVEWIIFIDG